MATVEKTIDINQPVSTVYNQWTQFEEFPNFMKGVEDVRQVSDDRLHWKADIAGVDREWDAEIIDQVPDQVIAWKAIGEVRNDGRITFDPLGENLTRVRAVFHYEPEGFAEKAADALNMIDNRVEGDLKRFKEFIEQRGHETGAWRGEIH
ncbi:MAG TPA: SRPBCC family protein [Egibacteraceae bacterium]|nr:SRPBCC family protein [Egibacteraceae bacterium]